MKLFSKFKKFFIFSSIFRIGWPLTDKEKSEVSISSFLLHIQPAKVNKNVLKFSSTLGLGIISFYLFIILSITGILLMFYYVPSTEHAYDDIKDLGFVVSFGLLLRNMHRWAAHLMVATVFLHMCRVFYTGSFKCGREFNWIIGIVLLLTTLFLSFTGYLLPWDQLAYWAITVGTSIASYAPIIGEKIKFLLLGGNTVGQSALLRFYVLHVIVLPVLALFLIALHFWRIRKDGGLARQVDIGNVEEKKYFPASPDKTYGLMAIVKKDYPVYSVSEPDEEEFSWPNLIFREIILFIGVVAVLLVLSLFFNAPLEEKANFIHPTNPAKAPWYFLGLQELVSYSAFLGGVLIPSIIVIGLIILPYIDRNPAGCGTWFAEKRKKEIIIFTIFLIAVIIFTSIGMFFRGPNWSFVFPWGVK